MTAWCLPCPDRPGSSLTGYMELPGGVFVAVDDKATSEHYRLGAELSRTRVNRCKHGSTNWLWHRAVIAEHERREANR